MTEDPRYLRNQGLAVHRLHRRNSRLLRGIVLIWMVGVGGFAGIVALDLAANLGWGYEPRQLWTGLLMIAGGGGAWLFATFISHLTLGLSRRLYGAEPAGPPEG